MNKQSLEALFRVLRILIACSAVFGGGSLVAACDNDGPLEEAGEEIDDAIDDIEDEL